MSRTRVGPALRSPLTARLLAPLCALASLLPACTSEKIVPIELDAPENYDDLLDVEVEFCTRPVEDVVFPVKVLLVVDTSGSLQFTDQPGLRRNAVRELMNSLATQNDVFVSTIGFGSNIYADPVVTPGSQLFIPAGAWQEPAFLGISDVTTNYQGAFAAVNAHLLRDMLETDPAVLARTKYVVIFFSDGLPTPKCCAQYDDGSADPFGCPLESWEVPPGTPNSCEGDLEAPICNNQEFLDNFRDRNEAEGGTPPDYGDGTLEALVDLEANDNYNRVYQVQEAVSDMMELGEAFGVGELRMHTALLFDSNLPPAVALEVRANKCKAENLLQSMATLGNGIYRDFESSEEIDFLSFNFTGLKQGFSLLSAYAHNMNAVPGVVGGGADFVADSDGDGLSDEIEFALGTDVVVLDSDKLVNQPSVTDVPQPLEDPANWGDGFNDRIEHARLNIGFDPRFQSLPVDACPTADLGGVDRSDIDGDGLNGCEENLLGTDRRRADSDGDGLSDFLEARLGLLPNEHEGNSDNDFDGMPNLEEVRRGLDPNVPDADRRERASIRYELINTGTTADGRTCYSSTARGVRLVTTQPRFTGGRSGYNDIYFFIGESPADNPTGRVELRVACHRVQYSAPSFKEPANGRISIAEEDFYDLSDPASVAEVLAGDICRGVPVR